MAGIPARPRVRTRFVPPRSTAGRRSGMTVTLRPAQYANPPGAAVGHGPFGPSRGAQAERMDSYAGPHESRHPPALLPALARVPRPHAPVGPLRPPRPRAVRAPRVPEPHVDPRRGRGALA